MTMANPFSTAFRSAAAALCLLCAWPLAVSAQPSPAPTNQEGETSLTEVQFPNTPIPVILLAYERFTGKRVVRDAAIQDQTLSIITSGELTYADAATFIERSFLLNGYAILPTEVPDEVKIVAYASKPPSAEGVPVFTSPFQLPESEQIVTYIMPLSHLTPEAAAELFGSVVELHSYGKITPLQNASAVVITENSSIVRRLIELRDHLDVSTLRTIDRSFQLERADADDVVAALIDIMELEQATSGGSQQGSAQAREGGAPPGSDGGQAPQRIEPVGSLIPSQRGSSNFARPTAPKPRVRSIPRANRVLVVASPIDMEYIANVIEHLDAPVETSSYLRRKLKYIAVTDFLQIAGDVILRGNRSGEGQGQISGAEGGANQTRGGAGALGTDGQGDLSGSQRGGRGNIGVLGSAGADQAAAPQSLVIDKTLLVADNIQNMLIASGPPETLRLIEELLDAMDVRPSQIQISAVIARLNLGDEFRFGFDFLRTLDNAGTGNPGAIAGSLGTTGAPLLDVSTLTDVANLLPAAQGLTLYGQVNRHTDAFFSALENTNRFHILSRPTVYTVNNRQATIETGQRIAVPRTTLSSIGFDQNTNNQTVTANIDFEDIVLRIDVLPLINSDGEITLQIQQRNDEIIGSTRIGGDDIPNIGTQALGTTIMVRDGGTVLLGGLISEEDQKNESGLPLFTNLPLVGRVFGSTRDNLRRQELLVFIQPKIIRNDPDQEVADDDLTSRTRIGAPAEGFATGERDNLEVFESQDFNSAEKRVHFIRNLFRRNDKAAPEFRRTESPPLRAVPLRD